MKRHLVLLFWFLVLFPYHVFGACSWTGNTGTVDVSGTYTYQDIQDCVDVASGKTGEVTIQIPDSTLDAGSNDIAVNMRTGFDEVTSLIIKGQNACTLGYASDVYESEGGGVPTDCPTKISSFKLTFYGSPAKKFRLANLELSGTTTATLDGPGAITIRGDSNYAAGGGFRIDHVFLNATAVSNGSGIIYIDNRTTETSTTGLTDGLVDHMYSYNARRPFHTQPYGGYTTNKEWIQPLDLGGPTAIYVENSKFYTNNAYKLIAEAQGGGRYVFRYNKFTNTWIGGHDFIISNLRGQRKWEVYNNTFTSDADNPSWYRPFYTRSGNGVAFDNVYTYVSSNVSATYFSAFIINRANPGSANAWPGLYVPDNDIGKACLNGPHSTIRTSACTAETDCGGTNGVTNYCVNVDGTGDGDPLPDGYPARDQLGVGQNADGSQTGGGAPFLLWNNSINGSKSVSNQAVILTSAYLTVSDYVQSGRDYCVSESTMPATCNSIETTYSPFTYPHPLRGNQGTTYYNVTSSVTGSGGTINPFGPQSVASGGNSPTFSVSINNGWKIKAWAGTCGATGTETTYQKTNVTEACTVSIEFDEIKLMPW